MGQDSFNHIFTDLFLIIFLEDKFLKIFISFIEFYSLNNFHIYY